MNRSIIWNLRPFVGVLACLVACRPVVDEDEDVSTSTESTPAAKAAPPSTPRVSESAATPTPSIDAVWEEMPLPPTPVPPPTPAVPTPDPDRPARYFPDSEPEGVVLPTPGAVWRAGHLNGLPKGVEASYPESEYAAERNFAKSVHLRDPNRLPAFLETGQTLVVHLPSLPPDLYALHVASTGGTEEEGDEPGFYSRESYRRRFLRLRFNDRIVWQRTVPPFHAITKAVLDPSRLHAEGNTVVLENLGTHPIPLDAVWIAPHRPGERPMFVALDRGEWLNREDAGWVRTVVAHVDGTPSSPPGENPATGATDPELPAETLTPVRSTEDLPTAWERVRLRFRLLEELGHPDLAILRDWAPRLKEAVDRGAFPILHLDAVPHSPHVMEAAAYVFGGLVRVWILPGGGDFDKMAGSLRKRIPNVVILSPRYGTSEPPFIGLRARTYWQAFDLSVRDGRNRARVFAGSASPVRLPSERTEALSARFSWLEAYKPIWPGSRAGWATNSVAEWMMRRETPVILRGGLSRRSVFPGRFRPRGRSLVVVEAAGALRKSGAPPRPREHRARGPRHQPGVSALGGGRQRERFGAGGGPHPRRRRRREGDAGAARALVGTYPDDAPRDHPGLEGQAERGTGHASHQSGGGDNRQSRRKRGARVDPPRFSDAGHARVRTFSRRPDEPAKHSGAGKGGIPPSAGNAGFVRSGRRAAALLVVTPGDGPAVFLQLASGGSGECAG